ncbi:MAG TPA: cytochrome c [Rudaea sp.]|nr:cytochrome c [Rudaea sp.]
MHPIRTAILISGMLGAACAFAAEGGGAPGKTVEDLSKPCAACHGTDGNSTNPQYPRLAGQYHDYLARALVEYKTGERKNAIMAGFVSTLSDKDIDALSRYYGDMPGKLDDLSRHEQGD